MNKEKFGIILPITLLSYFLILMDNSIIFTSSLEMGQSLGLSATALSWVSSAYTLTFGGFLLLSGRLSDLLGRKRIFLFGLLIFGISSLVIGLLVGGGLTSFISWRAGFLINVPFALFLFFLALKYVKNSKPQKEKIDYIGSLLSILGLVFIIYGFTESEFIFVIVGIIILLLFIFWERKTISPILPLSLFKNKMRSGAYVARLLFMMSMLPFWYFLPQMMQTQYKFSAFQSGLAFLPLTIVNFIIAMQLPKLTAKFGNSRVLLVGEIILAGGLIFLALSNTSNGYFHAVLLPMIIVGLGQGLILAPVTSAGVHEASTELAGIASGITNTMHQIGGPIGLSLIVSATNKFSIEIWLMAIFTLISILVVAIFVNEKN